MYGGLTKVTRSWRHSDTELLFKLFNLRHLRSIDWGGVGTRIAWTKALDETSDTH
jgi:hypothetical protein